MLIVRLLSYAGTQFTIFFTTAHYVVRVRCGWGPVQFGIATLPHDGWTSATCLWLATYPVVCNRLCKSAVIPFSGLPFRVGFDIGYCTVSVVVATGCRDYGIAADLPFD
jgi:hypothetical protein